VTRPYDTEVTAIEGGSPARVPEPHDGARQLPAFGTAAVHLGEEHDDPIKTIIPAMPMPIYGLDGPMNISIIA
jgi:hypothetical protein